MLRQTAPQSIPGQPVSVRAYLALAAGMLIIGASAILVRAAGAPGPVSGFYRMAIGWVVLSPLWFWHTRRPRISSTALGWAALAGLFFGLDLVFWTSGIMLSGPTKPTLLANTTPLWVGLGAMVVYKERHSSLFWLSLGLALSGAVVVVGNDLLQSANVGIGSAFGLVSALFYSGFFLVAQRGRKQTDVLSFIWVSTLVSAVVLLMACVLLGQDLTGYDGRTVVFFLLMGVVIQVIGWLLITFAQGYFPASILSPTMLGQPVLTGLYSMMVFGERFSVMEFFGGLMVLGGVFLVHRSKHNRRKKERPLWKSQ